MRHLKTTRLPSIQNQHMENGPFGATLRNLRKELRFSTYLKNLNYLGGCIGLAKPNVRTISPYRPIKNPFSRPFGFYCETSAMGSFSKHKSITIRVWEKIILNLNDRQILKFAPWGAS